MSDKATIEIDYTNNSVEVFEDKEDLFCYPKSTSKSLIIAELIAPELRKLMKLDESTLLKKHIESLNNS